MGEGSSGRVGQLCQLPQWVVVWLIGVGTFVRVGVGCGRARQETGVVEAFIAGTRGWLRWNASRLISRNIIYRLSCPYVARTARYNTRTNTYKHVHTHTHTIARSTYDPRRLGDIDSFYRVFATHATTKTPSTNSSPRPLSALSQNHGFPACVSDG